MREGPVLGSAMLREGSWSRSNFFWSTSQCKPPNGTLGASNGFDQQSMTALASSRVLGYGRVADHGNLVLRLLLERHTLKTRGRPVVFPMSVEYASCWK